MNQISYKFEGAERLGFGFLGRSPTPTGLFLVFLALAVAVYSMTPRQQRSYRSKAVLLIIYGATVIGVGLTYSRGAIAALLCSLTVCAILSRSCARRWIFLIYLVTPCALISVPKGTMRIQSAFHINNDKAIHNRLNLWKGTCYAIVKHFPAAGGAYLVGREYEKYWQPLDFRHTYYTPVNLWLTIYAFGGPIVFIIAISLFLTILYIAIMGAWCGQDPFCLFSLLSLIAFGIGNCFSTVIQIPILAVVLICCIIPVIQLIGNQGLLRSVLYRRGLVATIITTIACLSLSIPFLVHTLFPPQVSHCVRNTRTSSGVILPAEWFWEGGPVEKGKLVIVLSNLEDGDTNILSGRLARAFCGQGYAACLISTSCDLKELVQDVRVQSCQEVYFVSVTDAGISLLSQLSEMPPGNYANLKGLGLLMPTDMPQMENINTLYEIPTVIMSNNDASSLPEMRLLQAFEHFQNKTYIPLEDNAALEIGFSQAMTKFFNNLTPLLLRD